MPSEKKLTELQMPGKVRSIVRSKGYKTPPLREVTGALERVRKGDPSAFGSAESCLVLVKDIAADFIGRYHAKKKRKSGSRSCLTNGT